MSKAKSKSKSKVETLFNIIVMRSEFEQFFRFGPVASYVYGDEDAPTKEELMKSLESMFSEVLK